MGPRAPRIPSWVMAAVPTGTGSFSLDPPTHLALRFGGFTWDLSLQLPCPFNFQAAPYPAGTLMASQHLSSPSRRASDWMGNSRRPSVFAARPSDHRAEETEPPGRLRGRVRNRNFFRGSRHTRRTGGIGSTDVAHVTAMRRETILWCKQDGSRSCGKERGNYNADTHCKVYCGKHAGYAEAHSVQPI